MLPMAREASRIAHVTLSVPSALGFLALPPGCGCLGSHAVKRKQLGPIGARQQFVVLIPLECEDAGGWPPDSRNEGTGLTEIFGQQSAFIHHHTMKNGPDEPLNASHRPLASDRNAPRNAFDPPPWISPFRFGRISGFDAGNSPAAETWWSVSGAPRDHVRTH